MMATRKEILDSILTLVKKNPKKMKKRRSLKDLLKR